MSTRTTAKAQDAGPLVVCCARAEAQAIRSALSEMEDLGHTLELVEGVEADPKLLTPVIERLHGDGLYVLCRSKLLGRDTVEQLREILLTHHVPFGRTVTVATQRPRDLVDRVKASVARSGTRRGTDSSGAPAEAPRATAREPSSPGLAARTAIPPLSRATLVATPAAIARSRAQSRPASARDLAFEDAITGAQPVVSPRVPIASDDGGDGDEEFDPPTIELPELRERRALAEPTDPELSAISLTDAAIEVVDEMDEMDEEDVDPLHDIDNSLAGVSLATVDFSDLERADSGRIALHGLSVPVRTGNTSVAPAPAPPPREPSIPGPPIPSPAVSRSVPSAPRTTTVEVPAVPQAASTGSTLQVAPAAVSSPASAPMPSAGHMGAFAGLGSVSAPAGAAASASLDEGAPPRGRGLVWAVALAGVAVVALAIAAVVMTGDDGEEKVASADAGKDSGAADSAADPSATPSGDATKAGTAEGSEPAADPSLDAVNDDAAALEAAPEALAAVGSALADRKVRALDILLVQSASVGPMTHGDARTYCEALDLAGMQGWRLPEVGELYSLSEAGMVGPAVYWSHTAGDTFGDSHLAWHGKRKRVQHESGKSKVLCVHGERAAL
jgi:hypothetical protein